MTFVETGCEIASRLAIASRAIPDRRAPRNNGRETFEQRGRVMRPKVRITPRHLEK